MPRLKRLTIGKFPRVKPGTELVFNEGANVLLGINGSGKTTLLRLLSMVCSGTFAGLERVDFHLGYEFEHDGITYAAELRYDAPRRIQSVWGRDDELMRSSSAPSAAKFTASLEIRWPGEAPIRLDIEDGQGRVRQGERVSELTAVPSLFEYSFISAAILAIFNSTRDTLTTPDGLFGVDAFPVARLDESTQWLEESLRVGEFEIRERPTGPLATAGTRTAGSVRQAALARFLAGERRPLVLEKGELEFLAETVTALGHVTATMRLDVVRVTQEVPAAHAYGRYEFRFVKPDGTRLSPADLSFGQQRLFAFLYYAAMHPHIVIVDELTNGMHHAMIERCLRVVQGRQAFIATQSPLLLDNLEFAAADEARRTFILCANTELDGEEQMAWRNMSADEAETFYRDYHGGSARVGEVLRRWGMW